MKNILILLIVSVSATTAVLFSSVLSTPAFVKVASESCPFKLDKEKLPVMVVRIVDNSNLSREFSSRCLYSQLAEDEGVVLINRENEPMILNELARQSNIPASPESIQPIGEILVPTHLYVINEKQGWVDVSLSEVKTGKFHLQTSFEYRPAEQYLRHNAEFLFKCAVGLIAFLILVVALRTLLSPAFNWLTEQENIKEVNRKFQHAKELISKENIMLAGDLLVECAKSKVNCKGSREASEVLSNISKRMKG